MAYKRFCDNELIVEVIRRLRGRQVPLGKNYAYEGAASEKVLGSLAILLTASTTIGINELLADGTIVLTARRIWCTEPDGRSYCDGFVASLHPDSKPGLSEHWFTKNSTPVAERRNGDGVLIFPKYKDPKYFRLSLSHFYVKADGLPLSITAMANRTPIFPI